MFMTWLLYWEVEVMVGELPSQWLQFNTAFQHLQIRNRWIFLDGARWCFYTCEPFISGYFKGDLETISGCICRDKEQRVSTGSQDTCSCVCGDQNMSFHFFPELNHVLLVRMTPDHNHSVVRRKKCKTTSWNVKFQHGLQKCTLLLYSTKGVLWLITETCTLWV